MQITSIELSASTLAEVAAAYAAQTESKLDGLTVAEFELLVTELGYKSIGEIPWMFEADPETEECHPYIAAVYADREFA